MPSATTKEKGEKFENVMKLIINNGTWIDLVQLYEEIFPKYVK